MEDMPAGVEPYTIPDDDYILSMFKGSLWTANVCAAPHLFSPEFGGQAERILVTSGPLQEQYDILGPVDVTVEGFDRTRTTGSIFAPRDGIVGIAFANSHTVRQFSQASPAIMNEVVRREALFKYGTTVDAVINVDYLANPKNDVSTTGLAVRFTDDRRRGAAP